MTEASKTRTEEMAVEKVKELILKASCLFPDIRSNDRTKSWDGEIQIYDGNIDKKENYNGSIKLQVKGRTTKNKNLKDKIVYSLDRRDAENYLKESGTLLFVCVFKPDFSEYKIYCASLLWLDLKALLDQYDKECKYVRIEMKFIKSVDSLEKICRSFCFHRKQQMLISNQVLDGGMMKLSGEEIVKCYVDDIKNMEEAIGKKQYLYIYDKDNRPRGLLLGKIVELSKSSNITIQDRQGRCQYSDVFFSKSMNDGRVISFGGGAFNLNIKTNEFVFTIKGTLKNRLKHLRFFLSVEEYGYFILNENEKIGIQVVKSEKERLKKVLSSYEKVQSFLLRHNIKKDLDFDSWSNDDFNKLVFLMDSIEKGSGVVLNSDKSMIGSVKIKDFRLSVCAERENKGTFNVHTIWNDHFEENHNGVTYTFSDGREVESANPYLLLNEEAYLSDDINFYEMERYYEKYQHSKKELELVNLQALEVIRAYDVNNNEKLLDFAEFLIDLVNKQSEYKNLAFINKCQINARRGALDDETLEKIFELKAGSTDANLIFCCNVLLGNKKEVGISLRRFDEKVTSYIKRYPIMKLLDSL